MVTISEPELLVPVTNTMSPAELTATAEALSSLLPGPLYRLAHSWAPDAACCWGAATKTGRPCPRAWATPGTSAPADVNALSAVAAATARATCATRVRIGTPSLTYYRRQAGLAPCDPPIPASCAFRPDQRQGRLSPARGAHRGRGGRWPAALSERGPGLRALSS